MEQLDWQSQATQWRFTEALSKMLYVRPTDSMVRDWLDESTEDLQQFCVKWARCNWMTGIGIIEAAQGLVEDAFENTNIDSEGNIR